MAVNPDETRDVNDLLRKSLEAVLIEHGNDPADGYEVRRPDPLRPMVIVRVPDGTEYQLELS